MENELKNIKQIAVDWALAHGFVYRALLQGKVSLGLVNHAPFSLFPTPFPKNAFEQVQKVQTVWNTLIHRIAHDQEWLDGVMVNLAKVDEFTGRLYELWTRARHTQEWSLGLLRNDYMVHQEKLYQVEINTVASSFSSHSTKVYQLHEYLRKRFPKEFPKGPIPPNDSLYSIPGGIAAAHEVYCKQYGGNPVVLLICQEPERNAFDQRWIESVLYEKNIHVIRRTLAQVAQTARLDSDAKCFINVEGEGLGHKEAPVSVVYFRAGYTPVDFPTEAEWDARLLLEKSKSIKSPTLAYHLVGTKKVQQVLAQPNVLERFVSKEEANQLRSVMTGLYPLDTSPEAEAVVKKCLQDPEEFVMKPQREGGGNNIYGKDIPKLLNSLTPEQRNAYILMDRIRPPHHQVYLVKEGECQRADALSELGIYGIYLGRPSTRKADGSWRDGETVVNKDGGWLLRTKRSDSNEGGVAAGFAVLDSPLLIE
jgi:glutathione synthetase